MADAYARGLERGLQMGARQSAAARALARGVPSAVPRAPRVRIIIIQQPTPIACYTALPYDFPFYGFIGPYAPFFPYWGSYAYGFRRGRFVPHSHFFPGTRGRYWGLFFPYGHFSRHGFLFGYGLVVR
ncbi:MAG: hypothetical protein NZ578_07550 [Candidatus Binatia bacterium]|nr:hypothetical protein [Candidatus Binatia bacterium]